MKRRYSAPGLRSCIFPHPLPEVKIVVFKGLPKYSPDPEEMAQINYDRVPLLCQEGMEAVLKQMWDIREAKP